MIDEMRATDDERQPPDISGADLDLMGDGIDYAKFYMPDPDDPDSACIRKEPDGACPTGCCECATFRLQLDNWARIREMERENGA